MTLLDCRTGRGRPKKNWKEMIREDLNFLGLTEDMVQDRSLWDLGLELLIIGSASLFPLPALVPLVSGVILHGLLVFFIDLQAFLITRLRTNRGTFDS